MSQRIQSPSLQDPNLKSLASLDGLDDVPLARLCIYKTPALDLLALLDKPLPELQAVRLAASVRWTNRSKQGAKHWALRC